MPTRKPHNSKGLGQSFPRVLPDPISSGASKRGTVTKHSGAPTGIGAFIGFLFIVGVNSVILWLAVRILHSAEVVEWHLSVAEVVSLAILWVVWRSLDRAMHVRPSKK
jgi:hypothetical protein